MVSSALDGTTPSVEEGTTTNTTTTTAAVGTAVTTAVTAGGDSLETMSVVESLVKLGEKQPQVRTCNIHYSLLSSRYL